MNNDAVNTNAKGTEKNAEMAENCSVSGQAGQNINSGVEKASAETASESRTASENTAIHSESRISGKKTKLHISSWKKTLAAVCAAVIILAAFGCQFAKIQSQQKLIESLRAENASTSEALSKEKKNAQGLRNHLTTVDMKLRRTELENDKLKEALSDVGDASAKARTAASSVRTDVNRLLDAIDELEKASTDSQILLSETSPSEDNSN